MFMVVLVCEGCRKKVPQTEWLTEEKFVISQFSRQEDRDQGMDTVGLSLTCKWPSCRPVAVCVHMVISLWAHGSGVSFSLYPNLLFL